MVQSSNQARPALSGESQRSFREESIPLLQHSELGDHLINYDHSFWVFCTYIYLFIMWSTASVNSLISMQKD